MVVGILWLVATLLYYFILKIPASADPPRRSWPVKQKRRVVILAALFAVGIIFAFLTRRPFFETGYFYPQLSDNIREIHVGLDPVATRHTVRYSDKAPLQILIHARGFAWTGASDTKRVRSDATSDTAYQVIYETETQGYFSELTYEIEVVIPSQRKDQLTVVFTDADGRQDSSGE